MSHLFRNVFSLGALFACCLPACAQSDARPAGILARVALVSDTHCTRGVKEEQPHYRERLEQVMAQVNASSVDLVLIAGDLTENGEPEEVSDFKEQIRGFKAPVWFVPGNHDVGNKRGQQGDNKLSAFRVARFEMRCGPSFFAREHAGLRVIGLNSPIFGSGFGRERAMWRFLEKELGKTNGLPTLVFMHYPPFLKKPDEASDYWNINPEPRRRLLALFEKGGVKTVLSGHLHRPLSNRNAGILFVTTGPVSFGLPKGKQPQGWTLVTLNSKGEARTQYRPLPN
jgi:3',5'-cyclic AMP phosphodiesterase CpdA